MGHTIVKGNVAYSGGGDPAPVFSPDERQVSFSRIGPILSGLQLALEATHAGQILLTEAFL